MSEPYDWFERYPGVVAARALHSGSGGPSVATELLYLEHPADVSCPANQSTEIFNTEVDFTGLTSTEISLYISALDFTAAQGGTCKAVFNYGENSVTEYQWIAGQVNVKGPICWPARFIRQGDITPINRVLVQVVMTVGQYPVIAHGDPTWGPISLKITAS